MEDICDILLETYNVNKIDIAAKELKDALYDHAKKCSDENPMKIYKKDGTISHSNKRLTLIELLNNHFNPDVVQPMPKFIGGPTTLTVHKSADEKIMIYIFGEEHNGIKDCSMFENKKDKENKKWNYNNPNKMTIDYFLYELMKTTSVYLDIYFEFPAFEESSLYHPSLKFGKTCYNLPNLFKKFKNCIGASRSKDDCRLARIHFFDARFKSLDSTICGLSVLTFFVRKFSILTKNYDKDQDLNKLIEESVSLVKDEQVNKMLNSLGTSNDEEFSDFLIKSIYEIELISKETKSGKYQNRGNVQEMIRMESIKSFMEAEILKKAMSYRQEYIDLVKTILAESKKDITEIDEQEFLDSLDNLKLCIIDTSSIFADIYLLARLFKDFDMTKIETHGNFITDQPTKAHNVIIYAGNNHSLLYRRFLNEIAGFEEIASTGKYEEKDVKHCINMETIPQPFFSTWTKTPTK